MNPGSLKHRVSFFKTITATDEDGFKTKQFTEFLSTKCAIKQTAYTDNNRSSSKNLDSAKTLIYCTVRYHKDIDATCTVELYDEKYRIKSLANVNYENRILELVLQNG